MPSVRRIRPQDKLETGFRAAHNDTADAIFDASRGVVTPEGVVQFYNDLGVFLGDIDLSDVFELAGTQPTDENGDGGEPFSSATEDAEGVVSLATADEGLQGENEFKAITPAVLTFVLQQLGLLKYVQTNPQAGQILELQKDASGNWYLINRARPNLNDTTKNGGNETTDGIKTAGYYRFIYAALGGIDPLIDSPVVFRRSKDEKGRDLLHDNYVSWSLFAQALADHTQASTLNHLFLKLINAATPAALARLCELLPCATGPATPPAPGTFTLALTHYELIDETVAVTMPAGALDTNNCDLLTGWGQGNWHRIFCDVTEVDRIQSSVSRTDVRTALQNAGITVNTDILGFTWTKPQRFKDGQPHTWTVKSDAGALYDTNVPALLTCATAVEREYMPPVTVNEGGLGQQVQMVQVWTGGTESVYLGSKVYSLVSPPPGVSINAQGIFSAAADSVSTNTFVEVHIAVTNPDRVIIGQAQIINQDCVREAGTTVYGAAWNFTPQAGGGARLFASLDDANNTAGAKFDNTQPGTLNSDFFVAIKTLAVGQKVYAGTSNSCELAGNNIYYLLGNGQVNTVKKAIKVVNGLIAEIKDSTYATPTTPTVPDAGYVHDNTFTAALPNTYTPVGGTWAVGGGQVCQTDASAAEGRLVLSGAAPNANRVFAKLKIAQKGNVPSVGVGLCFANGGGYNLCFIGDNKLQFLNDGVAFGPAFDFNWQPGVEYWFDLKKEDVNGQTNLSGRVWKDGTARPATYPYSWAGLPARAGSAVLIGKAGNLGPACVGEWYVYAPAAPTEPPAVDRIDVQWVRNNPGNPHADNRVFFFVRTTNAADAVTVRWTSSNGAGSGSVQMTALTGDAQGCQWGFNLNFFVGANLTFFFTPKRGSVNGFEQPVGYVVPDLPTQPRVNLYPAA